MRTLAILSALGYFVQGQTYTFDNENSICTLDLDGSEVPNADCCRNFMAQGDDESLLGACEAEIDEETIMTKEVYETQKEQCDAVTLTRMIHYADSSAVEDIDKVGAITYEATDVLSSGLRCCINPDDWYENINACVDCSEAPKENKSYAVNDENMCIETICTRTDKCAEMNGRTMFVQEGECQEGPGGATRELTAAECCELADLQCD